MVCIYTQSILWFLGIPKAISQGLLPTFPIMYVQVHLSKHTSSCIKLHQHSFSSFTLFYSILSYPSLHSIDYQLHQKDPDFPAEVHILNFFWSLSRKNFHQLTLQTCSILKWQKYPNSGKLSLLHWKWLPNNKNIHYRSIYVLKLSSF